MSSAHKFGPFLVPEDEAKEITFAGFQCRDCRRPVRRLARAVPALVARAVFYSCECGTVFVWEDERQPADSSHWRQNMRLLRRAGADLLLFNGNKPLSADFGGLS